MAGYYEYAMSNNAVAAYENGEKPLSRWTKKEIIDKIEDAEINLNCSIDNLKKVPAKVLKEICLSYSSWHHTSNHFNRTDFYSVDYEKIAEITNAQLDQCIADYKKESKEVSEEKWECTFLEWSGSRKHPKATEVTEIGIIKGNYFYRKDGTKKKTTANGFQYIKRIGG